MKHRSQAVSAAFLSRGLILLQLSGHLLLGPAASHGAEAATPLTVTQTDGGGKVTLVSPDDPFEYWRSTQFSAPTLALPHISGILGDPDGDGIPNFIEYAAGSGPWYVELTLLPQPFTQPDGTFAYQYYRSKTAGDVDLVSEFSFDLQHWRPADEFGWAFQTSDMGGSLRVQITSPWSPEQASHQFTRLQAVRPSLADLMRVLTDLNATPEQLLAECVISTTPASFMQGALTRYPRRYGYPNYVINWYFANIGLYPFVETHKDIVKAHLERYIARLEPNFTIRDVDIKSGLQALVDSNPILPSDSDDAYAGTFLRLASRFALAYPADPWFAANLATLKDIAQANIVSQIKPNHLVQTFQNGVSAGGNPNSNGYLMDNVEVWAGLNEFVQALSAISDTAGVATYQAVRDEIRDGIHANLWDETAKAWKWADSNATADAGNYYPTLMCQYYPELYGMPHRDGEAETQRRYDLAWQWIVSHKPDWFLTTGWTPVPEGDIYRHKQSDLALALVATRHADLENARSYLALAIKNWAPHASRTPGSIDNALISQIGYWQALLKGTPPRVLSVTPFSFTSAQAAPSGAALRSNAVILGGFSGYVTAYIPLGATLFVNGVARTGVTTSVTAGDTLWLETAAPASPGTSKLVTLKVGGYSSTWSILSAAASPVPDQPAGTVSGYTPVSASVGDSGSSQVSIPIVVPPGTGGMAPKLAITYSSQGGNSPLGTGFNLSGLSAISRVGRTIAQDGVRGGVNLDTNDRFALDGQRLIAISGTDGGDGTEYRQEFDPGSRIRSYGGTAGNPQRWVVETKAGLKLTFATAVRGFAPQTSTYSPVLSWAVDSIIDTLGNEIQFQYSPLAGTSGELLVVRISYTANANAGLTARQQVLFEYESRPDTNSASIAGFDVQSTRRLKKIESRALDGAGVDQVVRSYALTYQQDALTLESQLTSVVESGLGGVALPASTFEWPASNAAEPFLTQSAPTDVISTGNLAGDYLPGDYDGDGKTDVLVWNAPGQPNRFTLYRSNGTGFEAPRPTSIVLDQHTRDNMMVPGDFDGDGRLDMLLWSEADDRYRVYYSVPSGLNFQSPVGTNIPRGNTDNPMLPADFNGDGRTDVLVWGMPGTGSTYSLLLAEQTHFLAPVVTNVPVETGGQNRCILGEFNGDGRADLMVWNASVSRYDIYLCTGMAFSAPIRTNVTSAFVTSGSNISGDFNGDGLTDVMIWDLPSNPGKFTLHRCTGNGAFAAAVATTITGGFDGTTPNYQNVIDFNGDGKTDIFTWNAPAMNSRFNVTLSTGAGFLPPNVTGNVNNSTIILPGDYNGDGKPDFLMWNSPVNNKFSLWLNQGPKPRLLQKVTNGHGAYSKFEYKPLTDPGVHAVGVPSSYPNVTVQTPLYVVAFMTSTNGVNGDAFTGAGSDVPSENTMYYTYYGAWADARGRGFQGFSAMRVDDTARGVYSVTDYMIDPLLTGRPRIAEQHLSTAPAGGSTRLSRSESSWLVDTTTWPTGGKTYFVREDTTTSREYEPNRPDATALVKTTISSGSTYDSFGNLTHSQIDHGDGFTEATNNTYSNFTTGDWLIGRLTTSSVTKSATGQPSQTRSSSFGYHSGTGLLISETIEPTGGSLRLAKTYTHDEFGNILTSTFSAAGQQARTTTTTYSDDGRFLLTTTNALGHTETKTYDPLLGNVLSTTGPNGLTTTYEYDFLGRPAREVRPDGTESRSFYRKVTSGVTGAPPRAVHYVITQSSGSGPQTVWHDLLDRDIRTDATSFDGRTVSLHKAYSGDGTLYVASDPYLPTDPPQYNVFYYDKALRQVQELATGFNGNRRTLTTYDGLTTTVTNPLNQTHTTTTNVMGWAVQATDHTGKSITRSYDAYGNMRFVNDSEGHSTEIRYDLRGRKVWMSEPNSGVTTFAYNAYGELTSQTDAKGQTVTLTYDRLGRVTQRNEPSGVSTFTFDSAPRGLGQLASESGPGFSRTYTYDALCRPSTVQEVHGINSFVTSRSYDSNGRPDTLTYPTGFAVRQIYNAQGYLSAVKNASDGTTYWQADTTNARGQITKETLGNGILTERVFNVFTGLVETIIGSKSGSVVQNETYAWDMIGNLTRRTDLRMPSSFEETFTYDALNRLKRVDTTGANALTLDYDNIGNITTRSDAGSFSYGEGGVGPHAVTTVTGARAKTCGYDPNGNRTRDGTTLITYSSFNKPVSMTRGSASLQFVYATDRSLYHQTITQPTGPSTSQTIERDYVSGIYERETSTDGTVRHTHYIGGGTGVTAIYTEARSAVGAITHTTRYVHKDHLGSVTSISESDGAVKERLSFDAWGRRRTLSYGLNGWTVIYDDPTSAETQRGFTGHEMLDSMGLVHMNGRVYDPLTGRFLSPDPFVQAPSDMQNLNRYSYVLNNPLSGTDPSGFLGNFFKRIGRAIGKAVSGVANFVKDNWKPIVAIAAGIVTGGVALWALGPTALTLGGAFGALAGTSATWSLTVYGAVVAGAGVGFGSAFAGTMLNGGGIGDALRAGLTSGVIGGLSAGLTYGAATRLGLHGLKTAQTDFFEKLATKIAVHGAIQGGMTELQGGQFRHGLVSGAFSAAASPFIAEKVGESYRVIAASVAGGTASSLSGGKFGNGAVSGAFVYLFNQAAKEIPDTGCPSSPEALRNSSAWVRENAAGEAIFHCQAEVYKEVIPGLCGGGRECVYNPGGLILSDGPLGACAGTPNDFSDSDMFNHTFKDPGGILYNLFGPVSTSFSNAVSNAIVAPAW